MSTPEPLLSEQLESLIIILRGQRVILSPHLAPLYGVEPRNLIQAVKRNIERFPADFMFQLTEEENKSLRSQFVISNNNSESDPKILKSQFVTSRLSQLDDNSHVASSGLRSQFVTSIESDTEAGDDFKSQTVISKRGGTRYLPYAFTQEGVVMLSSVLRSPRGVAVNIEIMRAFVRLRHLLAGNAELMQRMDELEASVKAGSEKTDQQFRVVFDAIRQLMTPPAPKQGRIGFRQEVAVE